LNLLLNATQAIPQGSPRTHRIRVTTRTDERGWAVVEVADNGVGIPPGELGRIFDPFFTTKREGMGLGLSVCQRIVNDRGGTIVAESAVGVGSTFRVSLPPWDGEAGHDAAIAPPQTRAPVPRLRILVIDDDPALLKILAATLSEQHAVVTADGCDPAIALLRADRKFDVILCDLMMPLGDGMALYHQLDKLEPSLQQRIIFMTGGAFTSEAERFLKSIPNETIGKPFDIDALDETLKTMLRKAGSTPAT
jgi:CheY-like chemotaxis protein